MQPIEPQGYINPYLAGFILGLVLLSSFVIAGHGLGASGLVSQTLAHLYQTSGIENRYFNQQNSGESFLQTWIVIEGMGIFIGAFLSGWLSGRIKKELVGGEQVSRRYRRILMAIAGGAIMGFAARLARGCTSGQALTGGALLSAGSWLFMIAVFIGAYLTIHWVKREWS